MWWHRLCAGFEVLTLMEKVPTDDEDRPLQVRTLLLCVFKVCLTATELATQTLNLHPEK